MEELPEVPELESDKKFLDEMECKQLELFHQKDLVRKARLKDLEKQAELADARVKIEQLTSENLRLKKQLMEQAVEKERQEHREYNKHLEAKYNLSEKWGLNPLTGEIIEE